MHEFKHPKYYKELRARNKSDQAISLSEGDGSKNGRASDPGHKRQASSSKRQAATGPGAKLQASSLKHQATSITP